MTAPDQAESWSTPGTARSAIFPAWLEQLKPGGRILAPYQIEGLNTPLLRLDSGADGVIGRFCGETEFMPLQGRRQRGAAIVQDHPLLQSLLSTAPRMAPPLWEEDISDDWPRRRSLLFFLHLRDPRALAADGRVLSFGMGRSYGDLLALHAEWKDLGCPTPESYEVRAAVRPRGGRSWVLERGTPLTCSLV